VQNPVQSLAVFEKALRVDYVKDWGHTDRNAWKL
jgi:hypothetical protein